MLGLLGKKIGMTQIFDKEGKRIPVTVIEAGPCSVSQIKTIDTDGYNAVQVAFGASKRSGMPEAGHFKKANIEKPLRNIREFRVKSVEGSQVGQTIKADIFKAGEKVDVIGTSIGKGTAGTVKRWHFNRGPMTHGSKCHRLVGSIGAGTTPGRVEKGTKMSGRMGNARVTVKNLLVVDVNAEKNMILLKGAVPGPDQGVLLIRKKA